MGKEVILILCFLVCSFLAGFSQASEIYLAPDSVVVDEGVSFYLDVYVDTSESDVYALEYDVSFDESVIDFSGIYEGLFFSGAGSSFFSFAHSYGKLEVVQVLNESFGVSGNGVLAEVVFNAVSAGRIFVNVSDVIFLNSTITNTSAKIQEVNVSNASVVVNVVSGFPSSSGGGSSGGGGGSIGIVIPESNFSNGTKNSLENFSENVSNRDKNFSGANNSGEQNSSNFLPLTGRIVENIFGKGGILKSWAFWFLIFITIAVGVVLFLRVKKKKFKGVSHY